MTFLLWLHQELFKADIKKKQNVTLWVTELQHSTSERGSVLLQNKTSASKKLEEFRVVLNEEKTLGKLVQLF